MASWFNWTVIQAVLRNIVTAGGTVLVTDGIATQSQADAIGGGLLAVAALGWSLWQAKAHADRKVAMTK